MKSPTQTHLNSSENGRSATVKDAQVPDRIPYPHCVVIQSDQQQRHLTGFGRERRHRRDPAVEAPGADASTTPDIDDDKTLITTEPGVPAVAVDEATGDLATTVCVSRAIGDRC